MTTMRELMDVELDDDDDDEQFAQKKTRKYNPRGAQMKAIRFASVALVCIMIVAMIFIVRSAFNYSDRTSDETQFEASTTVAPTAQLPTLAPSFRTSLEMSDTPSNVPSTSLFPSQQPTTTASPTSSLAPSSLASSEPSLESSSIPTATQEPSGASSFIPSLQPTSTQHPTDTRSSTPSFQPSLSSFPTAASSVPPTLQPTIYPSISSQPTGTAQPTSVPAQWTQVGRELEWKASVVSSPFGGANVAISGNGLRIAGGTPENAGPINSRVRIWEWTGEKWERVGGDFMKATHVVMDETGNRIVVGKRSDGIVLAFDWTGSEWMHNGTSLTGFDALEGLSMSSDGKRLAIADEGFTNSTGRVCIFDWDIDSWQRLGDCLLGEQISDNFGYSISLSGDGNRIVVGAPTRGYVKIYEWVDAAWVNAGRVHDDQSSSFGLSVAISHDGTTIVAGGWSNAVQKPIVRVCQRDAVSSQWQQTGNEILVKQTADHASSSLFDMAVGTSFDGSRVCIGFSRGGEEGLGDAGQVQVFDWTGLEWVQQGQDLLGTVKGEHFGRGVAVSNDGGRIIVGAECGEGNECSTARVYTLTEAQ